MPETSEPLLVRLSRQPFFTIEDLQQLAGVKPASARVLATRYCRQGIFLRLKRGIYALSQNWERLSTEERFRIANFLQVPSYISFQTALSFYQLTTQLQRDWFESAVRRRTARYEIRGVNFVYYRLAPGYFSGFVRQNGIFIATPEKALLDTLYLHSLGRYRLDLSALETGRINWQLLRRLSRSYPLKTRQLINRLCRS